MPKFIEIVKRYTDFDELTALVLNEYVEKIIVHETGMATAQEREYLKLYRLFESLSSCLALEIVSYDIHLPMYFFTACNKPSISLKCTSPILPILNVSAFEILPGYST